MRFKIDLLLNKDEILKDKNRIFISLFKTILLESDEQTYHELYDKGKTERKDFTFSINMPKCKFNRETISIPEKKISLFFSAADLKLGIAFYNAFIRAKGKVIKYKDLELKIVNIALHKEVVFTTNSTVFRTSSPIVIREHNKDTNKDWYYDLSTEEGYKLFIESLKNQVLLDLPGSEYDLNEFKVEVISNKTVKVKHYGIEVLSNLATFKVTAKPYILSYMLNAGVGSFKSAGFGMLTVV
ncbi:CRISPR-associated endoribonuclease Cas6 [Peptoniphilus asaccharolyticus DSM 20463]|uniref:CRISPR-associated endoribonuclease Cas6 n=1 Tax=Peptoniphilus asaccharolyticus DSM 20463 TaxID=573058 RepID=A0A1W1VM21_PEPAS|nr:CRISPR-associated endoribonuclease Cas6 [Peptoniphilus asaccharolyticus]MBL7574520.1 CRISPR-associated endoribonuclease Cas6 [Peptoniphilus asaccharolyticus]SMB94270.1 CRISPR-associated endoribonuclease Cas6 [Peptoniphilus asaccharolyticus DSM 20463]